MSHKEARPFYAAFAIIVAVLIIAASCSACQPKTVVVEQRGDTFVQITPMPNPNIQAVNRGTIEVDGDTYHVFKLFDIDEKQVCTMIAYGKVGYRGRGGLSCRPMRVEEYGSWK